MWSIHTMEYYSALKRMEILTPAATWMNPEDIRLSEMSQSQKDKHCMIDCTSMRTLELPCPQRQKAERWAPGVGGQEGG